MPGPTEIFVEEGGGDSTVTPPASTSESVSAGGTPANKTFSAFTDPDTIIASYTASIINAVGSTSISAGSGLGPYSVTGFADGDSYALVLDAKDASSNIVATGIHSVGIGSLTGIPWIDLDLSTFTKDDPLGLENTASLGVFSDLDFNTGIQARPDADRDGLMYIKTLVSSITWSNYKSLLVNFTAVDWAAPGAGAISYLMAGGIHTASQSAANGVLGGIQVQHGGNQGPVTEIIGANPFGETVYVGDTEDFTVEIPFTPTGYSGVVVVHHGDTSSVSRAFNNLVSSTDLILAIAFATNIPYATSPFYTDLRARYWLKPV